MNYGAPEWLAVPESRLSLVVILLVKIC